MSTFIAKLKRRNVLRAGALYIGAAWALAQGIAQLGPVVGFSDSVTRWFLVAAVFGFPFWLAFAWFYGLTPQGLKREGEVVPEASSARRTARKLDLAIIGVLAVAVVLLLTDRFVVRKDAVASTALDRSVAVLPLANESGDASNGFFSDGLTEQLISDLSRIEALRVIGRSSSFRFRDSQESLAMIGAQLGVAHLIEGTVRQSGERVRIVIGMIRVSDGSTVWSQSYDRELKDIFAVQADISQAVATALETKLLGTPITAREQPPSGNFAAYQAVLQGRALVRQGTQAASRQAISLAEKAIQLDPDYAYAHAVLSNWWLNLGYELSGEEQEQAYEDARRAADRALALAPDLPAAHRARGYVLARLDFDNSGALAEYRRALALAPGDGHSMAFLAGQLGKVGEVQQAVELMRSAITTDPLRVDWYGALALDLMVLGRLDEAEEMLKSALAMQPTYPGLYARLSTIDILRGNAGAALHNAAREVDPERRERALVFALQIGDDRDAADAALQEFITKYGTMWPFDIATIYALRQEPETMFEWFERAWAARDQALAELRYDPFTRNYQYDPRFAEYCRKVGVPAP